MKLKPYKEILAMSKEALNAAIAPIRAKQAKSQGELEMMKIDEKLISLEAEIHEVCSKHPLCYDQLIRKLDEVALLERRKKQFGKIIDELFE